ncbi:hypothetical protein [Alteromonas sp. CYL-A6]|uniref:hypothetical protein n=1 Tax=Alteromonas nitratireducens TaxID=3390813 RepID=UPI0034BD1CAB
MKRKSKSKAQLIASQLRANRRLSSKIRKVLKRKGKVSTSSRKNPSRRSAPRKHIFVQAPEGLDLYNRKAHLKTVTFIKELTKAAKVSHDRDLPVRLCFRHTTRISASGGIYLYAVTDSLKVKYPKLSFIVAHPPKKPDRVNHENISVVQAVLKQIKFYSLIGVSVPKVKELPNVDCWATAQSEKVDSDLLGAAIQKLEPYGVNTHELFRAGVEAMANAAEHAYDKTIRTNRSFPKKEWWLFTAVLEKKLIVYICDLGHGIPVTMPHTQKADVLTKIKSKVTNALGQLGHGKAPVDGDVFQIQASTLVKETRTELGHRGKGGNDIRSFIDNNNRSSLYIFSNKGTWKYKSTPTKKGLGIGYNNKHSIDGTVIGWSIPLSAED